MRLPILLALAVSSYCLAGEVPEDNPSMGWMNPVQARLWAKVQAGRKEGAELFCQSESLEQCAGRREQARYFLAAFVAKELPELQADEERQFETGDCDSISKRFGLLRDECWAREIRENQRAIVQAQRELKEMEREQEQWRADPDPTVRCFASMWDKPELQDVPEKFLPSTAPLATLAGRETPTEAEKRAISAYVGAVDKCHQLGQAWRRQNYPAALNSLEIQQWNAEKALIAQLYAGRMTYGDFVNARSSLNAKYEADVAELIQKIQAQQAQRRQTQRQYEQQQSQAEQAIRAQGQAARRQILMQMIQNDAQQQAIQRQQQIDIFRSGIYQPRPTVNTNCYQIGNQWNCTSR